MAWPGGRPTYTDLMRCEPWVCAIEPLPSGYAQLLSGMSVPSPLPVNQDPTVGAFIRDGGIPASALYGTLQPQYIPTFYGDGRIGYGAIGMLPIGYRRPYHGKLTITLGVSEVETPG